MSRVSQYLCSSIGKKQLMALTGLAWCGFVLVHMLGNLLVLVGPAAYNNYGHKIISNPALPLAEGALVLTFVLHVVFAILVTRENRAARTNRYLVSPKEKGAASASSKTMIYSGMLTLAFLILHLVKFKYGPYYPMQHEGAEIRDLYKLMQESFVQPLVFGWYVLCLIMLGMHLKHALQSSLNTFGFVSECALKKISCAYGFIVSIGFLVTPVYFFFRG